MSAQPPLQMQIEQKIALVKTRIEEVVKQIRTGSPWNREQRPLQLGNQLFIGKYAQPKYWDIKKPLLEQDKGSSGSRITIEERPFRVSNSDIDCLQVNLKDFTKITLQRHDSILIQSHKEYQLLKSHIDFVKIQINHLVELFNKDNRKVESIEVQLKIEKELCLFDILSQQWQYETKDYPKDNHCRIIAVILNRKRFDQNLYIYKQELNKIPANPAEFATFINSPEEVQFMLEILKIHHLRDKHAKYLKEFKEKFQEKVKKSLVNGYIKAKEEKQKEKKQVYENLNRLNVIENYELLNSKMMIEEWHSKAIKMQTSKVKNLFIEVEQIWISKGVAPDRLKLYIETEQQKDKQNKFTTYGFRNLEGNMLVYKQIDNLPKCSKIILKQGTFGKSIHFKVAAEFKGKTAQFEDYYIENNIQSDNFAFTHQLKLQNLDDNAKDRNCFIHFNIIQTKKMSIARTSDLHIASIFKNVGKIPTKYKSSVNIEYTPNTFPLVRQLVNKSSSSKLNKDTFQSTYNALVDFIQKEENLSQTATLESKIVSNGIPMKQRAQKYLKKLQIQLNFDISNLNDIEETQIFNELQRPELSIETKLFKNLVEDLKRSSIRFKNYVKDYMVKFIYYVSRRKRLFNLAFNLRYMSHLLPIAEKFIIIIFNREQTMRSTIRQSFIYREQSDISTFYTFLAFLAKLYPYADMATLKTDLFILRWLVQKNLTYFNDYLNRNHIGLENFIAPYLLTLFCGLSEELTFRIWDFLLMSPHKDKARIVVAFTLLTYMETTATLPIIPINQFMETVESNMRNLGVDREYGAKFNKVADSYNKDEINRHKRLQKIIKSNPANTVIEDKHLQKIILGNLKSKVPVEQQGKVTITKQHTEEQKTVTIDKIIYPLPKANHNGFPILQMQIFIHNLNILDNLNLTAHKFHLQFEMNEVNWKESLQVLERNYYYNKSIVVPAIAINRDSTRQITISIAKEGEGKVLVGSFNFSKYYKDKSYRCSIVLRPTAAHHNKGETILNLSFCLKSIIFPNPLDVKKYDALDLLSEKILDYDIGESNQSMLALDKLRRELERIKYPLDEFGSDQFKRLQNSSMNFFQAQLLQTSKTSIQELKTIFYNIFAHDSDKQIRHQFSKYYEIYAEEHNLQYIYFVEMMTKFVLLADITKKKKMTYLYCLGVHYQNCYSKKINAETMNSLIRLVNKQNTFVNACPYSKDTMGKIVEAYYFEADLKNSQLKKDFTQILQDWAYICNFKLGYSSVILGSWRDLSILRSLFDLKTIKTMEAQSECRFEVIYQIDGTRYLWSTVVETKTFTILKRGTKFLNSHASFGEIKFLSSTQEYLLNCENIIPLQNHKNYTYEEFSQELLKNSLFAYMVEMPSLCESLPNRKVQQTKIKLSSPSEVLQYDEIEKRQYSDWAIFRNQNCLQSWKRCKIQSPGTVLSKVQFEFDKNQYSVSSVDVLSMQQINLSQDKR